MINHERTQTTGIRKWAGDDLIELQKEPLDALQALVEPYAPCIIQGCVPSLNEDGKYTVSPGFVALKGKLNKEGEKERTGVKIVRFEGKTAALLPLYLGLDCKTENRAYADGGNKPIKNVYVAKELSEDTGNGFCLAITADDSANPHLVDTMGITQKLDRGGGDASETTATFNATESVEGLKSGNSLSKLFGAINGWLSSFKKKLDGIEDNANKYVHPTSTAGAKTSNLYKITTDVNGHITAVTAVTKADITALGIPEKNTTYDTANTSTAGLMSAADKIKLNSIATGANKYSHPTSEGNKHIPEGGSLGQYLKNSSSGTAVWADLTVTDIGAAASTHSHSNASTSAAGFMSKEDKEKLDKASADAVFGRALINNICRTSANASTVCEINADTNAMFFSEYGQYNALFKIARNIGNKMFLIEVRQKLTLIVPFSSDSSAYRKYVFKSSLTSSGGCSNHVFGLILCACVKTDYTNCYLVPLTSGITYSISSYNNSFVSQSSSDMALTSAQIIGWI